MLPLATLARPLIARGHEVLVIARDLVRVRRGFDGLPVRLLSAPFFPGISPAQQQNSLADVVWFDGGGHSADTLVALIVAWRELPRLRDADRMRQR